MLEEVGRFLRPAVVRGARSRLRGTPRLSFALPAAPLSDPESGARRAQGLRERRPRFAASERERGWHVQYDALPPGHRFIRDPKTLTAYDPHAVRFQLALHHRGVEEMEATLARDAAKERGCGREPHRARGRGRAAQRRHRAAQPGEGEPRSRPGGAQPGPGGAGDPARLHPLRALGREGGARRRAARDGSSAPGPRCAPSRV